MYNITYSTPKLLKFAETGATGRCGASHRDVLAATAALKRLGELATRRYASWRRMCCLHEDVLPLLLRTLPLLPEQGLPAALALLCAAFSSPAPTPAPRSKASPSRMTAASRRLEELVQSPATSPSAKKLETRRKSQSQIQIQPSDARCADSDSDGDMDNYANNSAPPVDMVTEAHINQVCLVANI